MSLYEKIGRLLKQNKVYEKYNSNCTDDSNIDSLLSDLLLTNKIDSQSLLSSTILFNNKLFTRSDFEEAQKLISNCSREGQLFLIAILEIQLTLIENKCNYIRYETINEKIIEKNIYWIISKEIHEKIHKQTKENEFNEYCHYLHDPKEKYILGTEYNFKYESIDSIICKLKHTNKNIKYIAIKSIFISFHNLACEYIQKYMEINEYNKENNYCEYSIFEYIINDYVYIINKIKFINTDFKQSLNDFKKDININFTLEDLFKDIFFNAIFHNQILGCQYIHSLVSNDNNIKKSILTISNLISNQSIPLSKSFSVFLNIDNLFTYKIDLASKIIEKNEQMHACMGIHSIGKDHELKKEEQKILDSPPEKEIIFIKGDTDKNHNLTSSINTINMEKIFLDLDKSSVEPNSIFEEQNNNNINKENNLLKKSDNENTILSNSTSDENSNINNNKNNSFEKNNEKMNMDNKSLDEIYEYISKDNKVKTKKKNKKRNKGKSKKNTAINKEQNCSEADTDDVEDPIVEQFKNDINEKVIFANSITKIKPFISEKWIKTISTD